MPQTALKLVYVNPNARPMLKFFLPSSSRRLRSSSSPAGTLLAKVAKLMAEQPHVAAVLDRVVDNLLERKDPCVKR